MIKTEKIKYGIGITADYSCVGLGTRDITAGSIESIHGATECEITNKKLGIENHGLFTHLSENTKDCFEITIHKDTDIYPLEIKATSNTAVAYVKIIVKAKVKVTIHEQIENREFTGMIIDVVVEEGADVTYIADQRCDDTYVLALRRAFVKRDATMKWIDLSIGGKIANSTIYISLDAPGASGETYGLFYGRSEQLHDITHTTIHRAPHTTSSMKTHGVLDEKAKAVYRSLIDIRENALNADGHQKEETLLLSKDAQISSVPDLEIANNEVSCSHGVSTTNIDDQSLFYFHSRGVDTAEAKQAIADGHLGAILDMINDESIKLRVFDDIRNRTQIELI